MAPKCHHGAMQHLVRKNLCKDLHSVDGVGSANVLLSHHEVVARPALTSDAPGSAGNGHERAIAKMAIRWLAP